MSAAPRPTVTVTAGAQQDATLMLAIPRGDAGTDATIEAMRAMAIHAAGARDIRMLAGLFPPRTSINGVETRHGEWQRVTELYAWLRAHVKFQRDPRGIERVQTPELLLAKIMDAGEVAADCDCLAPLMVATLLPMNLSMRPAFVVVSRRPAPAEFEHVFSALFADQYARPLPAHWPDGVTPMGYVPLDPQEVETPGQAKAGVQRIRVYPVVLT